MNSTDDLLRRLQGANATLLADALRHAGLDPVQLAMRPDIKAMFPIAGTVIGRAVTTKYELASETPSASDTRRFVFQPVDEARAGDVWITACGTDRVLSMMGDIIALACKKRGLGGIVTDGGCRDVREMAAIGLPVFSRGTCLYGPSGIIRPVAANVPVVCGGVRVRPGDVIVADVDGVLVIPSEALADVVEAQRVVKEKEEKARRMIEEGAPLARAYPA